MRQGRWEQKRQLRSNGLHAWALSGRDLCFEVISGFIDRLSSGRDVGLCPKKARDEYRKLGPLWALRITVPFAQVLRSLAATAPLSTLLFVRHLRLSGNPVAIRLSAPWWGLFVPWMQSAATSLGSLCSAWSAGAAERRFLRSTGCLSEDDWRVFRFPTLGVTSFFGSAGKNQTPPSTT